MVSSRQARGRGGRSASERTLPFLLVLLSGLLFGQALGGRVLWLHVHGPEGGHLHLLAEPVEADSHGGLHDWHDAQHGHEHATGGDAEEVPAPTGFLIDLPQVLAAPGGGPTIASAPGVCLSALPPVPRWHLALVESVPRHELHRSGWPPQRAQRSGVASLLRSSHAILI